MQLFLLFKLSSLSFLTVFIVKSYQLFVLIELKYRTISLSIFSFGYQCVKLSIIPLSSRLCWSLILKIINVSLSLITWITFILFILIQTTPQFSILHQSSTQFLSVNISSSPYHGDLLTLILYFYLGLCRLHTDFCIYNHRNYECKDLFYTVSSHFHALILISPTISWVNTSTHRVSFIHFTN